MPPHHQAIAYRLFNRRFLFTAIWTGIILFTAIPIGGIRLDLQIFYGGIYLWKDNKNIRIKKLSNEKVNIHGLQQKSCLHNYPTQARPLKSSRRKSKPNPYGNPERFPSFVWTMKTDLRKRYVRDMVRRRWQSPSSVRFVTVELSQSKPETGAADISFHFSRVINIKTLAFQV